jgi:hypothetical protein
VAIILHATVSGLALLLAPFQVLASFRFWLGLDRHRLIGRFYVVFSLIGSASAIVVAQRAQGGLAGVIGFSVLGVLWFTSTLAGFASIAWFHNVPAHELLMQISVALAYSAVSLRIMLPIALFSKSSFQVAYGAIAWLCWVVNLIVLAALRLWPTSDGTITPATKSG